MQDGYIDEEQELAEQEAEERQSVTIAKWTVLIAMVGLFGIWVLA